MIVGQDRALEQFASAWASRKLHHAWLLAGPGIGCFLWGLLLVVDRRRNATKPWPRVALGATVLLAVGAALVGLSAWTHVQEPTAGENDGPDVALVAERGVKGVSGRPADK